jgi:signal transduction histidine kinase
VLTVSDRGIGIDVTDEPRVFERFYRGERARRSGASGSGLGLAIARSIVRQHGGLISMKARDGGGTQVTVTLPQMEAAPVLGPSPASAVRGVERPAG